MKTITLTKGFTTIIDDDLFDYLNKWKWYFNEGYACRKENGKHLGMHRVILKTKGFVDHINGNGLDNRRCNLRKTNHSRNAMNMKIHKGKNYKGVSLDNGYWRTTIWKNNKPVFRISMPNERWAAMAYDLNAAALFGEYARLNFPNALGSTVKTAGELPE